MNKTIFDGDHTWQYAGGQKDKWGRRVDAFCTKCFAVAADPDTDTDLQAYMTCQEKPPSET
jgi:hypothetical protein